MGGGCVLLGGMSSSRSPRPLPRARTTQLHGDRRWQGPGGGNEQCFTATFRSIPRTRRQALSTFPLMLKMCLSPGRGLPPPLAEVRPQERVHRHTVEQNGDTAPFLPSLDVPVPLMGEHLVEVYKLLDVAVPEQVTEVPKIFVDDIPSRLSVREPQLAEQLVEVPTPSPALVPVPRMEDQLVEVPPIVPQFVPAVVLRGCRWVRLVANLDLRGSTGGRWAPPTPSGPLHRGTPPGQGGKEILAAATVAGKCSTSSSSPCRSTVHDQVLPPEPEFQLYEEEPGGGRPAPLPEVLGVLKIFDTMLPGVAEQGCRSAQDLC